MNTRVLHGIFLFGSLTLIGCSSIDAPQQQTAAVNSASKATIASWVDSQVLKPVGLSLEQDDIQYLAGSVDLNKDGSAEHMVLMQSRYFCGSGGCTGYIFDNDGKIINTMTVVKTPVVLAESSTNGWQDFIVWSNGSYRLMSYDGASYPSNPSLEPKVERDAERQAAIANVMATEVYQKDGYDIRPAVSQQLWTPYNEYYFTFKHHADPYSIYRATVDIKTGEVDIVSEPNPK